MNDQPEQTESRSAGQSLPRATVRAQQALEERNDPFASVLELGSEGRSYRWIALLGTLAVHAVIVGVAATSLMELAEFVRDVQADVRARMRTQYEFKVDRTRPKQAPEPPKPEPTPPRAVRAASATPPPPPVVEAPNLMALKPDPNAPIDLTGDGLVVGNSDVVQSGAWVSSKPSTGPASTVKPASVGVPGGTGTVQAPAEDLSRPPRLLTPELVQNCGFPPQADAEQIDSARVMLIVNVGANNAVGEITILSESPTGVGFGQRARSCAARAQFDAARDRQGRSVPQSVRLNFTFTRPH